MAGSAAETLIGAVVLVAAGGFLVYAANTADVSVGGAGGYELVAEFRKAEGLAKGSDVRVAGVKIGTVTGMTLDPQSYKAVVSMTVRGGIELPEDSSAKITATSLLGDNFVAIAPGASQYMLEPGGEIEFTQGSVNLLDLAGQAIGGGRGDVGQGEGGGGGDAAE